MKQRLILNYIEFAKSCELHTIEAKLRCAQLNKFSFGFDEAK